MRRALGIFVAIAISCGRTETVEIQRPRYIPDFYWSPAIHGLVIELASGAPVEGAVVVAIWRRVSIFSHRWDGVFFAREVATNREGEFTIPRWGPRESPRQAYVDKRGPELWVIKNGYLVAFFDNARDQPVTVTRCDPLQPFVTLPPNKHANALSGEYARPPVATSIWSGRTLKIRRATSPQELACSLGGANPDDPYHGLVAPEKLPRYWTEWQQAKADLPPHLRSDVGARPQSLIDYNIR